jgi:DnaJ-class molecular chaperone
MNPYLILGVSPNADDQTIRRAYLDGIKNATPETDPERFRLLSEAYEKIKDETSRYRWELFHTDAPGDTPLGALINQARFSRAAKPPSFEVLKEYLRACSKS